MKHDRSSRTAEYMALFRALERCQPPALRLFDDPFAASLLSGLLARAAAVARIPYLGRLVPRLIDLGWPLTRSSGVLRTRLIDDAVEQSIARGARQLLLLGAGFDSRGHRLDGLSPNTPTPVRVFEVDHPATQRTKRERLQTSVPANVCYVAVDFERDDLSRRLLDSGYAPTLPTVAVWEGVISYLSSAAVDHTFALLGQLLAPDSRLIFTYVDRRALDGSGSFSEAARWRGWVKLSGEPFLFGFLPDELPHYLEERGFTLSLDESTSETARRYGPARSRKEPGSQLYRVAIADRT